ncbi:DUF4232 domain-containing protein [Streptomyces sp. M41]|uniref:DUF4232 domain-containing protein n=1 Tax=Streptomyces sp. M41 TaxID=3059412 RepID=UPI00374CDC60
MTIASRAVPAAVAGVLLLAACGSERSSDQPGAARAGGGGGPVAAEALCPSDFAQYGSPPPTGGPTADQTPSGTPSPLPLPQLDATADQDAKVTGLYFWGPGSGCGADYSADVEITNRQKVAATYTVTISFLSASRGAVGDVVETVESLAPGRTVKRSVALSEPAAATAEVTGAKVLKVRSVPDGETATASGQCPASGVHVFTDRGDAAMGLRVIGLHLVNCGTEPYRINGYPKLELLDESHDSVHGVRMLQGTERISTGVGGQGSPRPVVLQPGEAAQAMLAWRNTTGAGTAVNAPYARVWAKPGARPVTVMPEFDLGTTGQLGVGAWKKDETYRADAPADDAGRPTTP